MIIYYIYIYIYTTKINTQSCLFKVSWNYYN